MLVTQADAPDDPSGEPRLYALSSAAPATADLGLASAWAPPIELGVGGWDADVMVENETLHAVFRREPLPARVHFQPGRRDDQKIVLASDGSNYTAPLTFVAVDIQFDQLIVENGQIMGVVLALSTNYYGTPAYIEQVVFRYYPTSTAAFDAYQQGEVFAIGHVTADVLGPVLEEPNLSLYSSRMPQMGFVLFNLTNPETPFLQDPKFRRALMLGLNRPNIINTIMQGQAFVADSPILPGSWAYFDGVEKFEYDPEAAIVLLKAEGYVIPAGGGDIRAKDGIPLAFTMVHPDDAIHTQFAQAIADLQRFLRAAQGPSLLHLKIRPGVPEALPRPDVSPRQVRQRLMRHLGIAVPWMSV